MTATQHRKHRGYRTQKLVAQWFSTHGWPWAESTGASRQGADITGTPDIAIEVKARRNLDPLAWIRQAETGANGRLPIVVFRPDGAGETTIHQWPILMRLEDLTNLLHAAGYGDHTNTTPEGTTR